MSEATTEVTEAPDQAAPPPFDPDPALIGHLEGNKWALRGYRREAQALREEAQAGLSK